MCCRRAAFGSSCQGLAQDHTSANCSFAPGLQPPRASGGGKSTRVWQKKYGDKCHERAFSGNPHAPRQEHPCWRARCAGVLAGICRQRCWSRRALQLCCHFCPAWAERWSWFLALGGGWGWQKALPSPTLPCPPPAPGPQCPRVSARRRQGAPGRPRVGGAPRGRCRRWRGSVAPPLGE